MKLFCVFLAVSFSAIASDKVWVSFDGSSVDVVRKELAEDRIPFKVHRYRKGDQVAVAQIEREDLWELTRIFHDKFNRCGGYMVHETAQEAHTTKTQVSLHSQTTAKRQAVAYSIDNAEVVNQFLDQVDEDAIVDVITHLTSFGNRLFNTQEGVASANWLREHWETLAEPIEGATAELFSHSFPQPSVILTIEGSEIPDEVIVLGGHLDSTAGTADAPGADDDASGIATITEVLRVMASTGFRPKRTVKFMGYAGEEQGLLGSRDIAQHHRTNNINVVGVMQLDMTNFHGSSHDIWLINDNTNGPQNVFLGQLLWTYMPTVTRSTTACGYACSDHASWHQAGFPASFPFEARFGEHNGNIHTAGDTLAVSGGNATHAAKFARLALAYVAELAKGNMPGQAPATFDTYVDVTTMLDLINGSGPCPQSGPCPRDLNEDGVVNDTDRLMLNNDWMGQTCLGFTQGDECTTLFSK